MLELITPAVRNTSAVQNLDNSDSETENILSNTTSTPIKTKATTSKNTPVIVVTTAIGYHESFIKT